MLSPANLHRAPLTAILITNLETATGLPCGDAEADARCGWQGQPGYSSNFVPYNVLMAGAAQNPTGSFATPEDEWRLPYLIWSFGVKRAQCESMADKARFTLSSMAGEVLALGSENYKVMQARTDTIGGVNRYDQTDPPYFGQQDVVTLWLTHER